MSSPRSFRSDRGSDPVADPFDKHLLDYQMDENDEDRSHVEDTQFGNLEIDTQATAGYDLNDARQPPQSAQREQLELPPPSSNLARFLSMPIEDDVTPAFTFGKAQKTLAIGIPRKGGEQASGPAKEVKQALTADNGDAASNSQLEKPSEQTHETTPHVECSTEKQMQSSPPKLMRRALLSNNDPSHRLSTSVNIRAGSDAVKLFDAMPSMAKVTKPERLQQPASDLIAAAKANEPILPPLAQVTQQMLPRKVRRKKTAPDLLQHGTYTQPPEQPHQAYIVDNDVAAVTGTNPHQQCQQPPLFESIESKKTQAQPAKMTFNMSFTLPADNQVEPCHAMKQQTVRPSTTVTHNEASPDISATMPPRRAAEANTALGASLERAMATDSGGGQMTRPAQARLKQQSVCSLPFPEAAAPSERRSSPKLANRPAASVDLQANATNGTGPGAASGRVKKRKRSRVGVQSHNRVLGHNSVAGTRVQDLPIGMIQEEGPFYVGVMPSKQESAGDADDNDELAHPMPTITYSRPAVRTASGSSLSPFELFDQAKNMLTGQVLQKDRELGHLKAELGRLVQTVQVLEESVSKLEGDKALLRETMHNKCESLKGKVSELLKDHKAVGGFIEKTNTDIAKVNKYREKSGSVFKEAISKYADLQQHQKKTMEAIHETRLRVSNDIADLTKAYNHESGIVLKDLQAEKKKVSELEKTIDAEKQKVMHLESRLNAGLHDNIKVMFEKQNEAFAAKVENHCKELLEAIDTRQEKKTASLKDYLKTLKTYKEHETEASKSIGELLSLITALSANVSEALKSKNVAHDGLQRAGTEILNSIKEKVESISEAQDNQLELANRVLLLETSKINLESQLKSEAQAKFNLQSQLEAKNLELGQNFEQMQLKDQELDALQSTLQQRTARSQQESDVLRSSLATFSEELKELKAFQVKFQEENQSLKAQNSRLKDEGESASERLRRLQESAQQTAERLKASEDEKSRILRRAESAEIKMAEIQAKFAEHATNAKQQLETQRIKMEEEKRRAVTTAQQGPISELSTLKKRYEKLAAENSALKDTVAENSATGDLEAESAKLQMEKSALAKSRASDHQRYQKAFNSQAHQLDNIRGHLRQSSESAAQQAEQLKQLNQFKERFETNLIRLESHLGQHENIEMKIRAYCEEHNWEYDEMDVETFLDQISTNAIDEYRQSLNSSSFAVDFPRPSMSFGQSMTAAANGASQIQPSQSSTARHRAERTTETVQAPGTQTPRAGRRSPLMPSRAGRSSHVAMVSPPRARRNHSIAERRRSLASSSKPPTPDTSGTPVRKLTDKTTGSGGRGSQHANLPPMASNTFEISDSSQTPSQKRPAGPVRSSRGIAPQPINTTARTSGDGITRVFDSDFSDLTDIMDMMDQNPEVDVIPVLEQQRRERASSIVEDSQSRRVKAPAMEPPATPREPSVAQSQEPKPLKSILKKRSLSSAQEIEEIVALVPPRKQLQPLKGKNSLASLGTGVVGLHSGQDARPSKSVGFPAREEMAAESNTSATYGDPGRPANISAQRFRRTKTIRSFATESEAQATPVTKKARMSIPYKPSAKPSSLKKN